MSLISSFWRSVASSATPSREHTTSSPFSPVEARMESTEQVRDNSGFCPICSLELPLNKLDAHAWGCVVRKRLSHHIAGAYPSLQADAMEMEDDSEPVTSQSSVISSQSSSQADDSQLSSDAKQSSPVKGSIFGHGPASFYLDAQPSNSSLTQKLPDSPRSNWASDCPGIPQHPAESPRNNPFPSTCPRSPPPPYSPTPSRGPPLQRSFSPSRSPSPYRPDLSLHRQSCEPRQESESKELERMREEIRAELKREREKFERELEEMKENAKKEIREEIRIQSSISQEHMEKNRTEQEMKNQESRKRARDQKQTMNTESSAKVEEELILENPQSELESESGASFQFSPDIVEISDDESSHQKDDSDYRTKRRRTIDVEGSSSSAFAKLAKVITLGAAATVGGVAAGAVMFGLQHLNEFMGDGQAFPSIGPG